MRRATSRRLFVALLAAAGVPGCSGQAGPTRNIAIKNSKNVTIGDGTRGNIAIRTADGVTIGGGQLAVNGRSYGAVKDGDDISIDGDTVKVNGEVRPPTDR
jgi:hypothetical protein